MKVTLRRHDDGSYQVTVQRPAIEHKEPLSVKFEDKDACKDALPALIGVTPASVSQSGAEQPS